MKIICQDALKYLAAAKTASLPNIVTGIPDLDEVGMTSANYMNFFKKSVDLLFTKVHPDSYIIFMVTDRKHNKQWIDKSFHIQKSAYEHDIPLRWHKIILLRPVGSTHIQRPAYQHYLCFSKNSGPGEATPDVMLCGKKAYKNASCPAGTEHAIQFIKRYSKNNIILDPFVGRGTVLKIAQDHGFDGIGIDKDHKQCNMARKLLNITSRGNKEQQQDNFPGIKKNSRKNSRKRSRKNNKKNSRKNSIKNSRKNSRENSKNSKQKSKRRSRRKSSSRKRTKSKSRKSGK
tara:strand:+ start:8467 stop:9330 length:864 start_codon:yes stop_codon:yes gene_type:complete